MAELIVGEIFEKRYAILSELGVGGMGRVYHAEQIDANRDVALKIPHASMNIDDEQFSRFFREFKILSQLSHPHIMSFYGMAIDEQRVPYAVCEYLQGTNLKQEILASKIDCSRAVNIVLQICDAMQYAHSKHILHRDLKPDNIFLMERPTADYVKIIDFGLANLFFQFGDNQKYTKTGALIGTAHYTAPESLAGAKLDQTADIYSLGCIFFEMVTGEHLFNGETNLGILYSHREEDLRPRMVHLAKTVPDHIVNILSKMLEKTPDKRFQSMAEVAQAFSSPESFGFNTSKVISPNRLKIGSFILLTIIVGIVSCAIFVQQKRLASPTLQAKVSKVSPDRLFRLANLSMMIPSSWTISQQSKWRATFTITKTYFNSKFYIDHDSAALEIVRDRRFKTLSEKGWHLIEQQKLSGEKRIESLTFAQTSEYTELNNFLSTQANGRDHLSHDYTRIQRDVFISASDDLSYQLTLVCPKANFAELNKFFDQIIQSCTLGQ